MKMHQSILIVLVSLLALSLVALPQTSPASADSSRILQEAVGSYMFFFLGLGLGELGQFVPGLITLTSDGTLVTATGSDEGGPIFDVKNSPTHGVWSRTGRRSVKGTAYFLNYDKVTGSVVGITRVRITASFDRRFDNLEGTFDQDRFICPTPFTCPNPLEAPGPGVIVVPVLEDAPFKASRIK
jgi:hypothetical protein